jgi:hypothetical protein
VSLIPRAPRHAHQESTARAAWLCGALALATAVLSGLGCGGLPPTGDGDEPRGAVVVMVFEEGTNNPLPVAATVIVGGVRGTLNPSDEQLVLRDVPLGISTPPTQPMTVSAPGYVTSAQLVQLNITTATWLSATLMPADTGTTGTVSGTVTDAVSGEAVVNAFLQFQPAGDEQAERVGGYTDSDGRFIIGGIPAGAHVVTAQAQGYLGATQEVIIIADDAGSNPDLTIQLVSGSTTVTVTGRVVDVLTRQPIPGATVTIGESEPAITDAGGSFSVAEVLVGERTIEVTAEDYDTYTATLNVMPGIADVIIELLTRAEEPPSLPYTLGGTVTLIGPLDSSGATVTATRLDTAAVLGTAVTSASGRYTMFVPPGRYRVVVRYQSREISREVEIPGGGQIVDGVDFTLTIE